MRRFIAFLTVMGISFFAAGGGAMADSTENQTTKKAVFAGGCFWCMESEFDSLEGVLDVQSGYTGGHVDNPTYEQVSDGGTGHKEAIEVTYDPVKVSYENLLDIFWSNVDPFDDGGQFCDRGEQYMAAIFYADDAEKEAAMMSRDAVEKSHGQPVKTLFLPAAKFWPAEDYHQDYHNKNPLKYKYYRNGCGRDKRLKQVWGE